jgi:glycosyltransferase involved in cell wall biosynthesis
MRVLYVLRSFAMLAGTERVVAGKINWLASHGYEVMLVTYEQGDHPLAFPLHAAVKVSDIDVRFFKLQHLPLYRRYMAYRRMKRVFRQRLESIVGDFRPDIILTTAYSLKVAGEIVKVAGNARLVMESHETCYSVMKEYDYKSKPLMRIVAKFYDRQYYSAINRYDCLVTLTHGDAEVWQRRVSIPVTVIPNPLTQIPDIHDIPENCDIPEKQDKNCRIISVGRLEHVKGFDRLIDAFAMIADRCPEWHLAIFGHGSLEGALRQQIAAKGMEPRVTIYPPTPHIYDEYLKSDLYVLSSRHEGFGMVLLEAMSCGLPCVAFDCKYGPAEIIADGETGLLAADGDTVAIADKMLWLINHREERMRMGQTARRQVVEHYRQDVVMQRWVELFAQLCQ